MSDRSYRADSWMDHEGSGAVEVRIDLTGSMLTLADLRELVDTTRDWPEMALVTIIKDNPEGISIASHVTCT